MILVSPNHDEYYTVKDIVDRWVSYDCFRNTFPEHERAKDIKGTGFQNFIHRLIERDYIKGGYLKAERKTKTRKNTKTWDGDPIIDKWYEVSGEELERFEKEYFPDCYADSRIRALLGIQANIKEYSLEQVSTILTKLYGESGFAFDRKTLKSLDGLIISEKEVDQERDSGTYNRKFVVNTYHRSCPEAGFTDFLEWVTNEDLFSFFEKNPPSLDVRQNSEDQMKGIPRSGHSTPWLRVIDAAIEEFYPDQNSVDPKRDVVIKWIEERAINEGIDSPSSIAKSVFTIIKRDNHNPRTKGQ